MKLTLSIATLLAALFASPVSAHEGHAPEKGAKHQRFDPAKAAQTPFGIAGDPRQVTRTIKLKMDDNMRFTPEALTIKQGETVKLLVTNRGKMLHEIVLGTAQDLSAHAEMMRQHPDMAHEAPQMLHVPAGTHGDIVWRFNQPGEFEFACLIPGHFEAGMKGRISVSPAEGSVSK